MKCITHDMPTLEGVKVLRQVKKFLDKHNNFEHWEDLKSDPTMVIVSFEKKGSLVLGEDGGRIRVFVSGRYTMVYDTLERWEAAIATMTPSDAAFHLWMTA